jgi:phosphoribosylcarboxyaminoimidazole (NCAIR) mutase
LVIVATNIAAEREGYAYFLYGSGLSDHPVGRAASGATLDVIAAPAQQP